MRTEIVCTLGPSTDNVELLAKMLMAGMAVARFNFSHGNHEDILRRVELLHQAEALADRHCRLMADTKGPEMRLGLFQNGGVELQAGNQFVITTEPCLGNETKASVNYSGLPDELQPGVTILLADGMLSLQVQEIKGKEIITKVTHGGWISDRKRIACPGLELHLPFLSAADKADILFAARQGFHAVAASFVQRAENVQVIRELLGEKHPLKIIAKIENAAGVKNLEEIVNAADGAMVARGDLGVELPLEQVPIVQKRIVQRCAEQRKVSIIATQMLESMCNSFRPTRAEVSDVATAVFEESSMVMLSEETAAGEYPLEAVETMARIIRAVESSEEYQNQIIMHCLHHSS